MLRRRKLNENLCQGDKSVSVAKHIPAEKIKKNPTCLNLESKKLLVEGSSLLITSQIISLSQITDHRSMRIHGGIKLIQNVGSEVRSNLCMHFMGNLYLWKREREKKV